MLYPKIMQPTHARWTPVPQSSPSDSLFPPVTEGTLTRLLTTDTIFTRPAENAFGIPGPDGDASDPLPSGSNGLLGVSEDLVDELPEECRVAFEQAREAERRWKDSFRSEREDGFRATLKIGYAGFPV